MCEKFFFFYLFYYCINLASKEKQNKEENKNKTNLINLHERIKTTITTKRANRQDE